MGDNSLPIKVLKAKYSSRIVGKTELNAVNLSYYSSLWWKDICRVGLGLDFTFDWFVDGMVRKIGNEVSIRFWHDVWVREVPLKVAFPKLFAISTYSKGLYSFGDERFDGGGVDWSLNWRRSFLVWQEGLWGADEVNVTGGRLLVRTDGLGRPRKMGFTR